MFQFPEQVSFIQDVFGFTLVPENSQKYPLMQDTYQSIKQKQNICLAKEDYIVDQALLEYLMQSANNPLVYLQTCKLRIEDICDKPWNQFQQVQATISNCRLLLRNYSELALLSPDDLFPKRVQSENERRETKELNQSIARLFDIFDQFGWGIELFHSSIPLISSKFQVDAYESVLALIHQWLSGLHVFQDKVYFYLDICRSYLKDEKLKTIFFKSKDFPWIPSQNGGSLDKGVEPCNGELIEKKSALGQFLSISLLQKSEYLEDRAFKELHGRMTRGQYEIKIRNYSQKSHDYVLALVELIKDCLKKSPNVDYFTETFRFLKACIYANQSKIKEGLHLKKKNRELLQVSSDGFMLNLFDVMLELSKKIFNRMDDTYLKIDPQFWMTIPFKNEQPLLSTIKQVVSNIQIGNVSNLFFYTLKFAQFGLIPAIVSYKEILKEHHEYKNNLELIQNPPEQLKPQIEKMKQRLIKLERMANQYESTLFSQQRITDTLDMYETVIILLEQWCKVGNIMDGQSDWQPTDIHYYLPEFIVTDIYEFYSFLVQFKDDYVIQCLTVDKAKLLIRFTTILLSLPFATNKYLSAQFIELLYLMTRVDKRQNVVRRAIREETLTRNNFLIGLLKYYIAVGETGDNHQFYTKFSYRLYGNELIIELLQMEDYQSQLKKYQQNNYMERVIKLMIGDTNHSIEEAWTKLNNLIELEQWFKQANQDPKERMDKLQQKQFSINQCKSHLIHTMSTVKTIVAFSEHIPQALLSDGISIQYLVFREQIVMMMNHMIDLILNKKNANQIKTLRSTASKEFKIDSFLLQIAKFYINLSRDITFIKQVVGDQRSFSLTNFSKLLNRISSHGGITATQVDDFVTFVEELQKSSHEEIPIEDLIDIPDKYLDPISGGLMLDPVLLPQSKQIIDRKSIKMALLEKQVDPFTNTPLKETELIELQQLKLEISNWLKSQTAVIESKKKEILREKARAQLHQQQQRMQEENNSDDDEVFQGKRYEDDSQYSN